MIPRRIKREGKKGKFAQSGGSFYIWWYKKWRTNFPKNKIFPPLLDFSPFE